MVTARIVRDLMRLCLLMERRYVPYLKWLGSAFSQLPDVARLATALRCSLEVPTWEEREAALCRAYEDVAARHNRMQLTPPLATSTRNYYNRPFQVIDGGRFATALRDGDRGRAARVPALGRRRRPVRRQHRDHH